jgi:hypothetical protein
MACANSASSVPVYLQYPPLAQLSRQGADVLDRVCVCLRVCVVVVAATLLLDRGCVSIRFCIVVAVTLVVLDIENENDHKNIRATNPTSSPYGRRRAWCCIVVTNTIQSATNAAKQAVNGPARKEGNRQGSDRWRCVSSRLVEEHQHKLENDDTTNFLICGACQKYMPILVLSSKIGIVW